MRASRFHQIVSFGLVMTAILGCNLLSNVSTPLSPSSTQVLETFSVQATTPFMADTTTPTAKVTPGTQTPVPPTPIIPGPAIPHMAAGQKFDITYIHMVDTNQGWGIGGPAQAEDHVFHTQSGGQTWRDVTPPQPAPTAGDTYCGPGVLLRCFQWLGCLCTSRPVRCPALCPYVVHT